MRLSSSFLLVLLVFASACPASEQAPPIESKTPEPVPLCRFIGSAQGKRGVPLVGLKVTGRPMKRVDERRWRGGVEETRELSEEGRFEIEVECGSALALDFDGWSWPSEPDILQVEPGMAPVTLRLVPLRKVLLRLESSPGRRIEGSFTRRAGPGGTAKRLPVPISGLQVEGISWGQTEGELQAEGVPSRPWALSRSHELHEVAPDRFEAVVQMGPEAPVWITSSPSVLHQIQGVWCVSEAGRGAACKRIRDAWLCSCGAAPSMALTSSLWSAAILRSVENGQSLHLPELPEAIQQCFTSSKELDFQVLPPGLSVDPLVVARGSVSVSEGRSCHSLPLGEQLEVLSGAGRRGFLVDGQDFSLGIID